MSNTTQRPWTRAGERVGSVMIRWMSIANKGIYRASGGRLGARFLRGAPVCLVTTVGRKSGLPRTIPLIYLEDRDRIVLVASKGGMSHSPMWFHNLEANPKCEVEIGTTKTAMTARRANPQEKAELWPRVVAIYRDYADYQARTTRDIPLVILTKQ